MRAMEKNRNRRYETAAALARDVERYLHDEPIEACPPSSIYRFRKFAASHRAALVATFASLVVLLAGFAGLVASNVLIARERDQKIGALNDATEQRRQAQENLNDALAAVDQMLTRVSEDRLAYVPQMEPVRRELLQDALRFYQKFLATRADDPTIRRETALAYRRVGNLHFLLGDYDKSEEAYRKGFAMLDALDARAPLDPAFARTLRSSYIGFSWVLLNQGKLEEGERWLRRAVATARNCGPFSQRARVP
jgi:tetratricopeptide (TPR) repeat protein